MSASQVNIEYYFRSVYEWIRGSGAASGYVNVQAALSHLWLWIVIIGYLLSVVALVVIVYTIVRLYELRKREEEQYHTLITSPLAAGEVNPRWQHIVSLSSSASASEWREAIIEADIMLDDVLGRQGYVGDGVGEKLKTAEFGTLQDAWEAHKVRNQIAHEGSAFALSESLARRTISRFESVFRELKAI